MDHGNGNTESSRVVTYDCETLPPQGCTNCGGSGDTSDGPMVAERVTDIEYNGSTTTATFEVYRDGNPTGQTRTRSFNTDPVYAFSGWANGSVHLLAQQADQEYQDEQNQGGDGGDGGNTITVDGQEQTPPWDR